MPTHYDYKTLQNAHGTDIKSHTLPGITRSNLKEMYIVRYADDFKIFCRNRQELTRRLNNYKAEDWLDWNQPRKV